MDVDNLLAGQRFDRELSKALDDCDVLIAIIGPRWMDLLKARTQSSERDYVREEIAAALQRGIVVIPARVGLEGRMPPLPRSEDLPEDISNLVLHQKHDVAHERFGRDVADLIVAIEAAHERLDRDVAGSGAAIELLGPVRKAQGDDYAETEADYRQEFLDEAQPRRGRSWVRITAALAGAISVGGALAYTYKSFIAPNSVRIPLLRADPNVKAKCEYGGAKESASTDEKMRSRLGDDRTSGDTGEPRRVRTVPIDPGSGTPAAQAPQPSVPGIMLEVRPSGAPPAPFKVAPPPQRVTIGQPPPPFLVPPPLAASATGAGYVAVLSSQKSRTDALKAFADIQQKYGEALSGRTPDVQEANLGEKRHLVSRRRGSAGLARCCQRRLQPAQDRGLPQLLGHRLLSAARRPSRSIGTLQAGSTGGPVRDRPKQARPLRHAVGIHCKPCRS